MDRNIITHRAARNARPSRIDRIADRLLSGDMDHCDAVENLRKMSLKHKRRRWQEVQPLALLEEGGCVHSLPR